MSLPLIGEGLIPFVPFISIIVVRAFIVSDTAFAVRDTVAGTCVPCILFTACATLRFGIGFKKNNQFLPIVFQKITHCSDYGPIEIISFFRSVAKNNRLF